LVVNGLLVCRLQGGLPPRPRHLGATQHPAGTDALLPSPCLAEGQRIFAVLARPSNAKSRPTSNVGAGETGLDRLCAHYGQDKRRARYQEATELDPPSRLRL